MNEPRLTFTPTSASVQALNDDYEPVGPLLEFTGEQIRHLFTDAIAAQKPETT